MTFDVICDASTARRSFAGADHRLTSMVGRTCERNSMQRIGFAATHRSVSRASFIGMSE